MTRVLVVVGRASSRISQSTATPRSSRDPSSSTDSRSVPTRPTRSGVAPSAARLAAVLAAPPGRTVACCLRTTVTGASGASRDPAPHQYLSRITSPITRIRWPEKCRKTAEALDTSLNVARPRGTDLPVPRCARQSEPRPGYPLGPERMPATESANAPSRSRLCLAVWCTPGFLRLAGIWANHLTFMSRTPSTPTRAFISAPRPAKIGIHHMVRPTPPVPGDASRYLPLLVVLFAGSGCSALIYETVWYQLLQLAIGSTAVSLGCLLATFMGGLCIGSVWFPRLRLGAIIRCVSMGTWN